VVCPGGNLRKKLIRLFSFYGPIIIMILNKYLNFI
jgi:hypothetical protein